MKCIFELAERERFFYSVYEAFVQYSASGLVRLISTTLAIKPNYRWQ